MPIKVPSGIKLEVICACNSGLAVERANEKYQVGLNAIYRWRQNYSTINSNSSRQMSPREIYLLQAEVERLRVENEIFRRSNCTVSAPFDEKLTAIKKLKNEYSVHALCRVLKVRRSTFYHFLNRKPNKTQLEAEDETLRPMIKELFYRSKERFGARKIRIKMMENGIKIGRKRINRLMTEMGLMCKRERLRYSSITNRKCKYYRNKVKRDFNPGAPNLIWVSDVTYIRVQENFHYVCVVIDLFARRVLAHLVSARFDAKLVSRTFRKAFEVRNSPSGLTFHSDQGTQYVDFGFRRLLRKLGVQQSLSHPGMPLDNAVAEAFFLV